MKADVRIRLTVKEHQKLLTTKPPEVEKGLDRLSLMVLEEKSPISIPITDLRSPEL